MSTEKSLKQVVEEELDRFEAFFCGELKNESLSRPERAVVSTYIAWRERVARKEEEDAAPNSH